MIAASGNWQGSRMDVGTAILIAGLACQLATFTFFLVVLTLFCLRVSGGHDGRSGSQEVSGSAKDYGFNPLVKQVIRGMWVAGILVEVSVFASPQPPLPCTNSAHDRFDQFTEQLSLAQASRAIPSNMNGRSGCSRLYRYG